MGRTGNEDHAVNLGQLFLSRNNAHLTFMEGKVSLQIGGSEVYLEEKGYSGLDRRADRAPAAARSYDRVPPAAREDRDRAPPEAREGAWTALLSPQEREWLLGRPRARGRGSPSHLQQPLSESDCVICPLEETFCHRRPGGETGESPRREAEGRPADRAGDWRVETQDQGPLPLERAPTWRPEDGRERREGWDPRREQAEDLRVHEREQSRERLHEEGGRASHTLRGERCPRDRGEPS